MCKLRAMQCLCLGRIIASLLTCLGNQVLLLNSVSRNEIDQCSGKMCVIMRYDYYSVADIIKIAFLNKSKIISYSILLPGKQFY